MREVLRDRLPGFERYGRDAPVVVLYGRLFRGVHADGAKLALARLVRMHDGVDRRRREVSGASRGGPALRIGVLPAGPRDSHEPPDLIDRELARLGGAHGLDTVGRLPARTARGGDRGREDRGDGDSSGSFKSGHDFLPVDRHQPALHATCHRSRLGTDRRDLLIAAGRGRRGPRDGLRTFAAERR